MKTRDAHSDDTLPLIPKLLFFPNKAFLPSSASTSSQLQLQLELRIALISF